MTSQENFEENNSNNSNNSGRRLAPQKLLAIFLILLVVGGFFFTLSLVSDESHTPAFDSNATFLQASGELLVPIGKDTNLNAVNAPVGNNFGWTIVGSIFDPATERETLAWWEPIRGDINDWELKTPISPIADLDQRFLALATNSKLQIAVGSEGSGINEHGAAWYRQGVGEWNAASSSDIDESRQLIKVDLSASGNAIAIGVESVNEEDVYGLWFSQDGKKYQKVSLELTPDIVLTDVAASAWGLVAVGTRERADGITEGLVFVSGNGINWRSSAPQTFSLGNNVSLTGVATNESNFTVTGGIQEHDSSVFFPMSWVSTDLEVWVSEGIFFEAKDSFQRSSTGGQQAGGVNINGGNFVSFSSTPFLQQVWWSVDGKTWSEVGFIKGFRETEIPVIDVALTTSDSDLSAVAITSDIGIWSYNSLSSWRELHFGIDTDTGDILPRIEDGPIVIDVAWDAERDRFIASGAFTHAEGESSLIVVPGRFWESSDLGQNWNFLQQFYRSHIGGPAAEIISSPDGVAAVGNQDGTFASDLTINTSGNPNPQGILWSVNDEGLFEQQVPYYVENLVTTEDDVILKNSLTSITNTSRGYILGGFSFFVSNSDVVNGSIYLVDTQTSPETFSALPAEAIGLESSLNTSVTALCSSPNLDRNVLFGNIIETTKTTITSALSRDDGATWNVGRSSDNSFDVLGVQVVNSCVGVSAAICDQPGTIFQNMAPCQNGNDFFLAVGSIQIKGATDARAWWSSDGEVWELLGLPPELTGQGDQVLVDVVANEKGIVLLGNSTLKGVSRGHIWVEDRGQLVSMSSSFGAKGATSTIFAGALNPDGYMVVVGAETDELLLARIWYSRDPILP